MTSYQTPDTAHEAAWVQLVAISYYMLYQAKDHVQVINRAWERDNGQPIKPSRAQRGFGKLLTDLGTPARPCKTRGISEGRSKGQIFPKREKQAIVCKTKKKNHLSRVGKRGSKPRPGEMIPDFKKALVKLVRHGLSPPQIHQMIDHYLT